MLQSILEKQFLDNSVLDYLISLVILVLGFLVVLAIRRVILSRIEKLLANVSTVVREFIVESVRKSLLPLLFLGVLYVSLSGLTFKPAIERGIQVTGMALFIIIAVRFLTAIIDALIKGYVMRKDEDPARLQGMRGMLVLIHFFIWAFGILYFLDNLGHNVTALIAGLGIGGIAIGLAAQAVLGDLFSYFAIFFDRPFQVGDFIIVGDFLGVVEYTGIKTTRVRSLGGEQIIFSNTDLTNSRVRNYKRMAERRVVFRFGVVYQTSAEHLKRLPALVKDIIEAIPGTRFDRAHFFSFGDFSLVFEVVYYVLGADYNLYMNIQQTINLRIKEICEEQGIEFAYPTQTLFLKTEGKEAF